MSAIDTVLVPGCLALSSQCRNKGTTVLKTGYHGPRDWLRRNHPGDYSIELPIDQLGPGDKGAAFDLGFEDARLRSDFRTIAKFSNRLYVAGKNKDPRAYPLREFFGNIDLDRDVEGWSFYRDGPRSSDSSHLWHIHFSIWRKYINDAAAMRSILSILKGEDMPLSESDLDKLEARLLSDDFVQRFAEKFLSRDNIIKNTFPGTSADNTHLTPRGVAVEIGEEFTRLRQPPVALDDE